MAHLLIQFLRRPPNPLQRVEMCVDDGTDHREGTARLLLTPSPHAHLTAAHQPLRSLLHLLHALSHLRHVAVQHQQLLVDVVLPLALQPALARVQLLLQLLHVTRAARPHVQQTAQLLLVMLDAHELLLEARLLRLGVISGSRPYEDLAQPAL